jgi:type VI secretion system protein ImpA
MKVNIDIETLVAPLPGDNPSGENLRYTQVFDDIKEARRADDVLDMGDWQREVKASDWDAVIRLSQEALANRSKDLQIAVWLTEALAMRSGFAGLEKGLGVINELLERFWETLYPEMDGEDLDYRIAPLEFLNDKLGLAVRQIPLTEPGATPGYSLLNWRESRDVGFEVDTKNKYGDLDEAKKARREALLAEGKIPGEEFDSCVARSSGPFYQGLAADISLCRQAFKRLDSQSDEKFGNDAPRLSDCGDALEECARVVARIRGDQEDPGDGVAEPVPLATAAGEPSGTVLQPIADRAGEEPASPNPVALAEVSLPQPQVSCGAALQEEILWAEALRTMENGGFKPALERLLSVANSQPSERGRSRFSLLVAKLCLRAGRTDLARPIMEQLNTRITDLQLDKWESPLWVAEVLDALYQCLVSGEPSDDDMSRAGDLFRQICTLNVTQALAYRR